MAHTTLQDTPPSQLRAPEGSFRWTLHVVRHPNPALEGLRRVLLPGGSVDLCRDGLDLGAGALADPRLSRRHARLTVSDGDTLHVKDLGSRNGTWVNERVVQGRVLDVDDVLRVGSVVLVVQRAPVQYAPVEALAAHGFPMAHTLATLDQGDAKLTIAWGETGSDTLSCLRWLSARHPDRVTHGGALTSDDESRLREALSRGQSTVWAFELDPRDSDLVLTQRTSAFAAFEPLVVRVPPLRERVADLGALLHQHTRAVHGAPVALHHRLFASLLRAPWSGNLDQLDRVVREHLRPTPDGRPVPWSDAIVAALASNSYLERSVHLEDARGAPVAHSAPRAGYRVSASGRTFELPDGTRVDLSTRRPLVALMRALVEHHQRRESAPLSTEALVEAGWPGEKLVGESGAGRVYVALSTLRRMGLRDVLERCEGGYRLAREEVDLVIDL